MAPTNKDKPAIVEPLRRVLIGVMWGMVPAMFVGWLCLDTEGPMTVGAQAAGALQRLGLLALASAVVAGAGLFGMRLLSLARIEPQSLFARFILGAGLSLGILSLVVLALGCAGALTPIVAAGLIALMTLAGATELRRFGRFLRETARPRFPRLSSLELALLFPMLLVLVFLALLAFSLPTDYDACEYHVAAPWRWAQLGRIDRIEGNVYTNLPMNAEMLHLFSIQLLGGGADWDRTCLGVHLGVVMNMMTALLATGAVWALARRLWSRRAAFVAAALFFTMPWTLIATTIFVHVEILLAFWATLAVYALVEFSHCRTDIPVCPRPDRPRCASGSHKCRWLVLSAVFAGLAGGVKYTALAFFPVAGGLVVLVCSLAPPRRGDCAPSWGACGLAADPPHKGADPPRAQGPKLQRLARGMGLALLYLAVVLLVVSPWLAKNAAFTGNPVFPFGYQWLGGRDWSAELDSKWYAGNYHAAEADSAGNFFAATWNRLIWPRHPWGSTAIALFAALALVRWRDRRMRWLWALVALWTLLWYFGTHRVDRFWLPMAGAAAALAGCGFEVFQPDRERKPWARAAGAVLTALLFAGIAWQFYVVAINCCSPSIAPRNYDLLTGNRTFLAKHYELTRLIECRERLRPAGEPAGRRLMLVGEARTLYLPATTVSSTVFNRETFTATVVDARRPELAREGLEKANIGEIFVNWFEVGRLRWSYALPGADGKLVPGLPEFSPADFTRLEEAGVLVRLSDSDPSAGPGFPQAPDPVRGLTDREVMDLPGGRIAALYGVRLREKPQR